MIDDTVEGQVDVIYSNISEKWIASFGNDKDGEMLAMVADTRPEALRELANLMEEN